MASQVDVVTIRRLPDLLVSCLGTGVAAAVPLTALVLPLFLDAFMAHPTGGAALLLILPAIAVVGAALGALLWLPTGIRFTPDGLVLLRVAGFRTRVPWADIAGIGVREETAEDGDVTARWLRLDRTGRMPRGIGVKLDTPHAGRRTRLDRARDRTREVVRREFAAGGFRLPDEPPMVSAGQTPPIRSE